MQREGCYLTGRSHTIAVDHITVGCTAVLLHLTPILRVRDAVDQTVLTVVREIGLIMVAVMRQIRRLGIGITIRSISPRKRMRIDMIIRTGLDIIEVQTLQHIIPLLDLLVGDKRFGDVLIFHLLLRTVSIGIMIDDLIPADVKEIVTILRLFRIGSVNRTLFTPRTQAEIHRIGATFPGGYFQEVLFFGNRIGTGSIFLRARIIGVP